MGMLHDAPGGDGAPLVLSLRGNARSIEKDVPADAAVPGEGAAFREKHDGRPKHRWNKIGTPKPESHWHASGKLEVEGERIALVHGLPQVGVSTQKKVCGCISQESLRGGQPKRAIANGARSSDGGRPAIRSAMSRPVVGPKVRPVCPWPKA